MFNYQSKNYHIRMNKKHLSMVLLLTIFNVLECGVSYAGNTVTVKNRTSISWNIKLDDEVAIAYCRSHNYTLKSYSSYRLGSNITTLLLAANSSVVYEASKEQGLSIFSDDMFYDSAPGRNNVVERVEGYRLGHCFVSAEQFEITSELYNQLRDAKELIKLGELC